MSGVFSQYKVIMLHVTCGKGSDIKKMILPKSKVSETTVSLSPRSFNVAVYFHLAASFLRIPVVPALDILPLVPFLTAKQWQQKLTRRHEILILIIWVYLAWLSKPLLFKNTCQLRSRSTLTTSVIHLLQYGLNSKHTVILNSDGRITYAQSPITALSSKTSGW